MSGIQLDSNPCGFDRHGREPDGIDMHSFFANCPSEVLRFFLVA
jgi:hypothetical protein